MLANIKKFWIAVKETVLMLTKTDQVKETVSKDTSKPTKPAVRKRTNRARKTSGQ